MEISKLPETMDPDKMITEKIDDLNRVCPFCHTKIDMYKNNMNFSLTNRSWYGKHDQQEHPFRSDFRFWEPDHMWKQKKYRCTQCGSEWYSDPYPSDISNKVVTNIKEKVSQYEEPDVVKDARILSKRSALWLIVIFFIGLFTRGECADLYGNATLGILYAVVAIPALWIDMKLK